jgi:predicted RNase H-like HicB family nuclease
MGDETITYYAKVARVEKGYRLTFPDLPGVNAFGTTMDEALIAAHDVLQHDLKYWASTLSNPTVYEGEEYYPIVVNKIKESDRHNSLEDTKGLDSDK